MEKLAPAQLTRLLQRWKDDGDSGAEGQLFELVQSELVKVAERVLRRESGFDHKIEPRELVSEAYLALRDYPIITVNRGPFFTLMARAMRHCLMTIADRDRAAKRPPTKLRIVDTKVVESVSAPESVGLIDFYRALDALRSVDDRQADCLEWRIYGLSNDEIAEHQRISLATVKRDLKAGRAFLAFQLGLPSQWIEA